MLSTACEAAGNSRRPSLSVALCLRPAPAGCDVGGAGASHADDRAVGGVVLRGFGAGFDRVDVPGPHLEREYERRALDVRAGLQRDACHQANQIEYLKAVNSALLERLGKKQLRFTDAERRKLAVLGEKLVLRPRRSAWAVSEDRRAFNVSRERI